MTPTPKLSPQEADAVGLLGVSLDHIMSSGSACVAAWAVLPKNKTKQQHQFGNIISDPSRKNVDLMTLLCTIFLKKKIYFFKTFFSNVLYIFVFICFGGNFIYESWIYNTPSSRFPLITPTPTQTHGLLFLNCYCLYICMYVYIIYNLLDKISCSQGSFQTHCM